MELFIHGQALGAQDLTGMTPPKNIPEVMVDGNPSDFKMFPVVVDGNHLMDFGWKYTGTVPTNKDLKLPAGLDWKKRPVYFFAVEYVNKTDNYIRFIEGTSSGDTWTKNSDGTWTAAPARRVKRSDVLKTIELYDVAPMADRIREDYYAYGPEGKEPYVSTTYVYYVENLKLWFAVTFIRTSP
jgi:hypothetical protein